jgi:ribosomal subunit interface protein
MQLLISGRNFKVGEELREHIDRRLQFALGKFDPEIERVDVGLSDVNGPKGGQDKHCRIVAKTRGFGSVVVEDADGDFYAVVSRAADRLGHTIGRTLDKKRNPKGARRRSSPPADSEEHEIGDV